MIPNNEGVTLPETNIFAPKNGWLEYDPFLLGFRPIFRGYVKVNFREGSSTNHWVPLLFLPKCLTRYGSSKVWHVDAEVATPIWPSRAWALWVNDVDVQPSKFEMFQSIF